MEIDREVDVLKKEPTAKETKGCGVDQGTARMEGDTWQKDVCTRCSCKVSDFFLVVLYLTVVLQNATVQHLDKIQYNQQVLTTYEGPCVVFLGKTSYSNGAYLNPVVSPFGWLNAQWRVACVGLAS